MFLELRLDCMDAVQLFLSMQWVPSCIKSMFYQDYRAISTLQYTGGGSGGGIGGGLGMQGRLPDAASPAMGGGHQSLHGGGGSHSMMGSGLHGSSGGGGGCGGHRQHRGV